VKFDTYCYVDCSTCHIDLKDSELLTMLADAEANGRPSDFCVSEYYEGYFVCVGTDPDYQASIIIRMVDLGFSAEAVSLVQKVQESGCSVLRLGCDGTEYDDLPQFDW